MLLIGMISFVSPHQGGAQNPRNYQRTIRITGDLVEVFEGDQPMILLDSYTGPVKGTSIWANLSPVPPWDLERTRFMAKNGQTFWIDMNEIQGLSQVYYPYGPITIHPNNMIEVWGAGSTAYYYEANGKGYYCSNDVNHFGVTQWAGADIPSETIRVVVDGSPLNGTLAPDGAIYLAESEIIGVPEWINQSVWWKKKSGWYQYHII